MVVHAVQVECIDGRRVCPCGPGMAEIPWPPGLPSLPLAFRTSSYKNRDCLTEIGQAIPVLLQVFDILPYALFDQRCLLHSNCCWVVHLAKSEDLVVIMT